MKHSMKLTVLAGVAVAGLFAVPAAAQETTQDRPFSGVYIGAAGGYDVQGNDIGSSIQFDRNGDGTFGDSVNTITGANAFSPGFCNGSARTGSTRFRRPVRRISGAFSAAAASSRS